MNISFRALVIVAAAAAILVVALSCKGAKSGRGFHLPDGNPERGQSAFVQLGCNQCHSVKGVDLPKFAAPGPVEVQLGGEVLRVKTYGQLVTSIIAPPHVENPDYVAKVKAAQGSTMPDYNRTMTVEQLIDVVAFLHAHYTKVYPEYRDFSYPYAPGVPGQVFPRPAN